MTEIGPWYAEPCDEVIAMRDGKPLLVATVNPMGDFTDDEAAAMGKLIAAAPGLLAALQVLMSSHETVGAGASIFQLTSAQVSQIRAAVAKAEGRG